MKLLVFFLSATLSLTLYSIPACAQDENPQARQIVFRVRVDGPSRLVAMGRLTQRTDQLCL